MKYLEADQDATYMLCPRALQEKEAAAAGGSAPSSPEQVHTHPGEELKCTSMPCQECFILLLSLSFPISSLAAPRDRTRANVDGQQGQAVAIVACDGAETSWYPPGQGTERRGQGSQHSREEGGFCRRDRAEY